MSLLSLPTSGKQTHGQQTLINNSKNPSKENKIALISGAGIAGLAASFELKARGFDVYIAEKREEFSRFNHINLNREVQPFLRKFHLLEEFEISVAARIKEHKCVVFRMDGSQKEFPSSDVSQLNLEGILELNPEKFKELFMEEGIYSVQIKDVQTFLAKKAAEIGVKILTNVEVKIVNPLPGERVSKVEIAKKNDPLLILEPDLFFIAEGANSTSVAQLKMMNEIVTNDCTDENWVFGNLKYSGDKTYVVSVIDASQKTLQIANVIFNAKTQIINVAVTSEGSPDQQQIDHLILSTAQKVFNYEGLTEEPVLLNSVERHVNIVNRLASSCSNMNVFRIGDAVGHSSPLAGLGGTLGLTLVPCTINKLLDDYLNNSEELHNNFKRYSQAYVSKWIEKSQSVKASILGIFKSHATGGQ